MLHAIHAGRTSLPALIVQEQTEKGNSNIQANLFKPGATPAMHHRSGISTNNCINLEIRIYLQESIIAKYLIQIVLYSFLHDFPWCTHLLNTFLYGFKKIWLY